MRKKEGWGYFFKTSYFLWDPCANGDGYAVMKLSFGMIKVEKRLEARGANFFWNRHFFIGMLVQTSSMVVQKFCKNQTVDSHIKCWRKLRKGAGVGFGPHTNIYLQSLEPSYVKIKTDPAKFCNMCAWSSGRKKWNIICGEGATWLTQEKINIIISVFVVKIELLNSLLPWMTLVVLNCRFNLL